MERRYEARLEEMLEDAEVSPEMLDGMLTRLETFVAPFAEALDEPAQRRHTLESMTGLLSNLEHKTGEATAYLHDQQRQGIQKFIGLRPIGNSAPVSIGRRAPPSVSPSSVSSHRRRTKPSPSLSGSTEERRGPETCSSFRSREEPDAAFTTVVLGWLT
jgi:hypothetical protein